MTIDDRAATPAIDPVLSMPRTRRALLAGAVGSVAALVAGQFGRPAGVSAAAGNPLILGSTTNTAGTADTSMATTNAGTALQVTQQGTGTALRGSAVGVDSIAEFFTATNGTGISGGTGRGTGYGVYGSNNAATTGGGAAIRAAGKQNHGLLATTSSPSADAARAVHEGSGTALRATTAGPSGVGVRGEATAVTGNNAGVWGTTASTAGIAVFGTATSTTGNVFGVVGETVSTTDLAAGAWGASNATTGQAVGVYGSTQSTDDSAGVLGWALASSGTASGVTGVTGSDDGIGVLGIAGPSPSIGVMGMGSGNGFGIFCGGRAEVTESLDVGGMLTKAGGSFRLDHPLDPANRFLSHSFVESPDMKNIYDGVATLDGAGEATVELPEWFEALNRDIRYQLTPIGEHAPVFIRSKAKDGRFKIAGGASGQEVSWQVTGIRQDAWAEAHRIPVEERKTGAVKGRYLHPEEHGQKASKGIKLPKAAERALSKPPKAPKLSA